MNTTKRIFSITLLVLTVLIAGVGASYLLVSDATLVAYLSKKIESASGTTISYKGTPTVSRTLAPTLSIAELTIEDHGKSFRFETGSLEIQVSLGKLLIGDLDIPRARLGKTQIKILQGTPDPEVQGETEVSPLPLKPKIHDLQISELSVTGNGSQLPTTRFDEVTLQLKTHPITDRLSGSLSVEKLSLPEPAPATDEKAHKKKSKSGAHVFSREKLALEWLNTVGLDLNIDIKSFDQKRTQINSAQISLAMGKDGLALDPTRLVYPKGTIDLTIRLDTKDTPQLHVEVLGKNLDPWQTLNIKQSRTDLKTRLNIDILIDSKGVSPHELAANADGKFKVTMRDGKLPRSLIDLVFIDVVGWGLHLTTTDKSVDVACSLADFKISEGIMTSNAFFLEGEDIAVGGDGTIDLGKEQIDFVLLPRKKSEFIGKVDPVTVKGKLNDPTISVLPWKSAAKTYGELVFAPYILPAKVLGGLFHKRDKKDDEPSPCLEYLKK